MSIGTVITEGYGSFGSVAAVVRFGYTPAAASPATPAASGGGGRTSRYLGYSPAIRRLDARKKKVEQRIEELQAKVEAKREQISYAFEIAKLQTLERQLRSIIDQLEKEMARLDEIEEQEVMLIYALTRR